jgi:hypothetical protein
MEEEIPPPAKVEWKVVVKELKPCLFWRMSKLPFSSIPFFDPLLIDLTLGVVLL